ncbi:MAG: AEC family transporter [Clostridia bacterium]|nr:AEC family transporter [Clostridia bacterium]
MFVENLLTTAQQVLILYILIAVGFFADKAGLYTEKASKLNTNLLFYIVTPLVIVNSFLTIDNSPENLKNFGIAALVGVAIHIVGIVITLPFFRKSAPDAAGIYKYASIYGNCGYMALPLANAVLGAQGVFYCSAVIMVFNIFGFTHGIYIIGAQNGKFNFKKLLINPGTIGVFFGLPLFLLGIELPEIIATPVTSLAALNTPLAMLIFGTYIAHTDLKTMLTDKNIYLVSALKLIAVPLVMIGIFRIFRLPQTLAMAMAISASAPSANNTVIFAGKYNLNTGVASKTVALVSFFSVLTMPVMIALSAV